MHKIEITRGARLEKASDFLASVANPVRLSVLCRLIEREWSVTELARDLKVSQSALSQHLRKLRKSRIVSVRRYGQTVFYRCGDSLVIYLLTELDLVPRQ